MVKCSGESDNPTKFCNTGDSDSRVHFKNTRVTTRATSMLLLTMARGYLEDALVREQTMPFTHFCRGIPSMVNMVELTAHFPFDLSLSHLVVSLFVACIKLLLLREVMNTNLVLMLHQRICWTIKN